MTNGLHINDIRKSFHKLEILRGISLSIAPGERYALIGPNGAGKTTLFHILGGQLDCDSGTVSLNNQNITRLPPEKRAKAGLGRSFQIVQGFAGLTVADSLEIALLVRDGGSGNFWSARKTNSARQDEIASIARDTGILDHLHSRTDSLSYGNVKKLELGLSLVQARHAWLLDEPTAGLDSGEAHAMADLIARMAGNRALVMIEHDFSIVMALADKISVLHQGHLIASDSPDAIRQNDAVRQAWLGPVLEE